MAQVVLNTCDICARSSRSEYCKQCRQHFCVDCKAAHLRTKNSRSHTFQNSFIAVEKIIPEACTHELLIFICADCGVPLCKNCFVQYHNGHQVSDINTQVLSLHEQATKSLAKIVREIKSKSVKQAGIRDKYNAKTENVIQAIAVEGAQMKNMVEEVIKSMNKRVRSRQGEVCKYFPGTVFDALLLKTDSLQNELDEIKKGQTNKYSSILKMTELVTKIQCMEIPDVPESPSIMYTSGSFKRNNIESLFGNLTFSSLVQPKTVILSRTSASESLGFTFVGGTKVDNSIYISAVDVTGVAAKAGLKVGDRIISVDGKVLDGLNHEEVANIFKTSTGSINTVVVPYTDAN